LHRRVERVRLVIGVGVLVAFEPHDAVGVIVVNGTARFVDRQLLGINADAIAVRV
jgi:hypothetical protein